MLLIPVRFWLSSSVRADGSVARSQVPKLWGMPTGGAWKNVWGWAWLEPGTTPIRGRKGAPPSSAPGPGCWPSTLSRGPIPSPGGKGLVDQGKGDMTLTSLGTDLDYYYILPTLCWHRGFSGAIAASIFLNSSRSSVKWVGTIVEAGTRPLYTLHPLRQQLLLRI